MGGDCRRLNFWDPVVNLIKSRLLSWKSKHLSFGGRLVLLKSILKSHPGNALSYFKAPLGIISSIKSFLFVFFSEDNRKITWIDWEFAWRRRLEVLR